MFEVALEVLFGRAVAWFYHPRQLPTSTSHTKGKVYVVTGSTSGIGLETAKRLLFSGGYVIMACRNTRKADSLLAEWQEENPGLAGEVMYLDLGSLASVKEFADQVQMEVDHIDCLIHNAGLFDMVSPYQTTDDNFELHFQVNYLSQLYLTSLLLDTLAKAKAPRIVNVSSLAHKFVNAALDDWQSEKDHSPIKAYGRSKMYQVMGTKELQYRLSKHPRYSHVKVFAVHPGTVVTEVARSLPPTIQWLYKNVAILFMMDARLGSDTTIHVATDPELDNTFGGTYFANCVLAEPHPSVGNKDVRRQLWDKTEAVLGRPIVAPADAHSATATNGTNGTKEKMEGDEVENAGQGLEQHENEGKRALQQQPERQQQRTSEEAR